MDWAFLFSAFLMGAAGSPHCAAMCAAPCAAASRAAAGRPAWLPAGVFQAARLLSYATLGAAVAASVSALPGLLQAAPWLRPLWGLLHAGLLALGLWLLVTGALPAPLAYWRAGAGGPVARGSGSGAAGAGAVAVPVAAPVGWSGRVIPIQPGVGRAAVAGGLWALWPCGLLYSALMVAGLAASPAAGALTMAAFAIGSAPGLLVGPLVWRWLERQHEGRGLALAWRVAGLGLVAGAVFALWRSFQPGGLYC